MQTVEKLRKMLEVVRDEILPLTEGGASRGNGFSGAAILRADTLTSVMIGSNDRVDSPLFHGEMDALNRFFKLPVHPEPSELIFLATHEPCPMCASAIAIAGFKELWVLFGAHDALPSHIEQHSAQIARGMFGVDGPKPENDYYTRHSLREAVAETSGAGELSELLVEIDRRYEALLTGAAQKPQEEPQEPPQA